MEVDMEICDDDRRLSVSGESQRVHEIRALIEILRSPTAQDRESVRRAVDTLMRIAQNVSENTVDVMVECGAVPVLLKHIHTPTPLLWKERKGGLRVGDHAVGIQSAYILGLLAYKRPERQQLIVDAGALPYLVGLLKSGTDGTRSSVLSTLFSSAAAAISNLAYHNSSIKDRVRIEGGIPPLVALLEFADSKVQRIAARALCVIANKNDENKNQIVNCNALPILILMMQSKDTGINYEAVNVIYYLVYSSPNIKKIVLAAGVLQPVIGLLRSCCTESQRKAARVIGYFASTDPGCKVNIVQSGALPPLIELLQSPVVHLRELSAFILARLAQDPHIQAIIARSHGVAPFLKLLESDSSYLQHGAAYVLYALADNEDNAADLIRDGGVQKLQEREFLSQAASRCAAKALERIDNGIQGQQLREALSNFKI